MSRKTLFLKMWRMVEKMWWTVALGAGVFILLAASVLSAPPAQAFVSAGCAPFPKISLWNSLTHDFTRRHVNEKFDGDWQAYIGKLQGFDTKLRAIQKRGTSAVVIWKDRNIRLKGASLAAFLKHLERRIEVTQCLSGTDEVVGTDESAGLITGFSTAAGGNLAVAGTDSSTPDKCDRIPQVDWWKFKNHVSIIGYVARRYRGDWNSYIGIWKRRLGKLQDIYGRSASAVTNTGVTLRGASLAGYIDKMQQRITVTQCLAKTRQRSQT